MCNYFKIKYPDTMVLKDFAVYIADQIIQSRTEQRDNFNLTLHIADRYVFANRGIQRIKGNKLYQNYFICDSRSIFPIIVNKINPDTNEKKDLSLL